MALKHKILEHNHKNMVHDYKTMVLYGKDLAKLIRNFRYTFFSMLALIKEFCLKKQYEIFIFKVFGAI